MNKVSIESLKKLVEEEYPAGLTVHNYEEWFGTLHSVLLDLHDRTVKICFGSPLLKRLVLIESLEEACRFSEVNVNF